MDQGPVRRMAERRRAVAELDGDNPATLAHGPIHARYRSLLGLSVESKGRTLGEIHIRL